MQLLFGEQAVREQELTDAAAALRLRVLVVAVLQRSS